MADVINRVKTVMSTDTASAKAAVSALRGVERARAKEVLDGLNKENAALEASLKRWAKAAAVIGGVTVAWKGAHAAATGYLEEVRLKSAAAGVDIERLQRATRGLVEEDKLLAFAGKAQAGVWKMTEREMDLVLKGAMALRKTMGVELEPTIEKLSMSIRKGMTEELKEFGIVAKDRRGVLEELAGLAAKVGGNFDLAGDDMLRSGVKMTDTLDDFGEAIGRIVVQLGPFMNRMADAIDMAFELGDKLSDAIAGVSSATNTGSKSQQMNRQVEALRILATMTDTQRDQLSTFGLGAGEVGRSLKRLPQIGEVAALGFSAQDIRDLAGGDIQAQIKELERRATGQLNKEALALGRDAINDVNTAIVTAGVRQTLELAQELMKSRKKSGRGSAAGFSGIDADPIFDVAQLLAAMRSAGGDVGGALAGTFQGARSGMVTLGEEDQTELESLRGILDAAGADARLRASQIAQDLAAAQAEAEQRKTIFESVFGSPDEITATNTALSLARNAVDGLSGAIASSFQAWVLSSESAGDAFRRMIGGVINSMGVELAQVGAKHAILAAVDLVTLNFPGAARHAGAAAISFAGAAAAFGVARGMGHGAGAASAGAGATGARGAGLGLGAGGGSSSGGPDITNIIYLTPEWDDETPTQRRQRLNRAVRRGGVNRTSNIVMHS